MKVPTIQVPTNLKTKLAQGHPWVYRNHLAERVSLPSGAWVKVQSGGWSGYGLYDAHSPIAIRLFSQRQVPDARWVAGRIRDAWERRAPIRDQATTAFRWLFGEGDGLPGLTVDLYNEFAVVVAYAGSVETLLPWLVEGLRATAPLKGILLRRSSARLAEPAGAQGRGPRQPESAVSGPEADHVGVPQRIETLWGRPPPRDMIVEEHGLRFRANLFEGQKTGLFLDQRENRRTLEGFSAGRSVLNCFAYTGGFSLYAARGGATQVTSVDIAGDALLDAAENFRLNGFDPDQHEFTSADVFELLQTFGQERRRFDVVVLDPPSLARNKSSLYAALRAYLRLNTLGLQLVARGGLLVSSSCTSQVSVDAFRDVLAQAGAAANRRLHVIHDAGQPPDHPVPAHFPEGRYLKFFVSHVMDVV
ncbi:MAG TPA: class I SAM-dependent rRNA methyltransferase [Ardenticatenaceae bacterium]|nr:class I SAM-dependent rRNA methyltransferase [Ardenticatenaceae bacterium]